MDETFLRMVDDLMPWETVCIKNSATVLGIAGKAHSPVLLQYAMNSSMSALYALRVFGA
jgi:hypothetical protein